MSTGRMPFLYHFPMGHFSVAMRSLAHVEHPHFMHRPVPLNADAFQKSQEAQTPILFCKVAASAAAKPWSAHFVAE